MSGARFEGAQTVTSENHAQSRHPPSRDVGGSVDYGVGVELDNQGPPPPFRRDANLSPDASHELEGALALQTQPQRSNGRMMTQIPEVGLCAQPLYPLGSTVVSRTPLSTTRGENHAHMADLSSLNHMGLDLLTEPSIRHASDDALQRADNR